MISPVDLHTMETLRRDAAECLADWQLAQVRTLIPYLRANSRFYAKQLAGIDETGVDSQAALARLPFTLPEEVRAAPEAFLCVAARDVRRVATVTTSGSTGDPKRFSFTANDIERTVEFFAYGMRSLTGEGRHVAVMLSTTTEASVATLLASALAKIGATASLHGHPTDMAAAVAAASGADCLVGMPHELLRLCRAAPHLRPESVLLTADYVSRSAVSAIEGTWRCKTYAHYGMTETGYGLAVQCFAGGSQHLRHADVLVEIVGPDGTPLPPGEEGEVVVTTFAQVAMPLLRYRTGDIASLDASPCACGGTLPRLGRIGGRIGGGVELDDGAYITVEELDETILAFDEVQDYRARVLRQASSDILSLTIDSGERLERRGFEKKIREQLPTPRIDFAYAPLPPMAGGRKRRIEIL